MPANSRWDLIRNAVVFRFLKNTLVCPIIGALETKFFFIHVTEKKWNP